MEAALKGGLMTGILSVGCTTSTRILSVPTRTLAASTRTLANPMFFGSAALTIRRQSYSSKNVSSGKFMHHSVLPTMFYQQSLPR